MSEALENLKSCQEQLDNAGSYVGVSRQALEETFIFIDTLQARIAALEAALIQIRDCDWVITLPDRMDAVREIARTALGVEK